MKTYDIVTNDEYELPVAVGLKTAEEVGEFLGIKNANTVRSRIHKSKNDKTGKHQKYKIIPYEDGVRFDRALVQKRYDMRRVNRDEYDRKRYLAKKERSLKDSENDT